MNKSTPHVIIIGAGFGGLYAAKTLAKSAAPVNITIIDRHNYHLFQPLLYQVATGLLSPEDIAYPIRSIFSKYKNITVLKGKVREIDTSSQQIHLADFAIEYDYLIVGTGVKPDYFDNYSWEKFSPGIKTIQDALYMRLRILNAFEKAERDRYQAENGAMNFVVIGGGPTGVELSGSLAELSKLVMKEDFRNIHSEGAQIYLLEASDNILPGFSPALVKAAIKSLQHLGVTISTNARVTQIDVNGVEMDTPDGKFKVASQTVLWAAGVKTDSGNLFFKNSPEVKLDGKGRVIVNPDLTVGPYKNIFVVGDLAYFAQQNSRPLPGVAPVAMQQGRYAAKNIIADLKNRSLEPFRYRNKGNLAVIGRNAAIADFGFMKVSGFWAWILWIFVHIGYLIGFQKKSLVLLNWAWNYFRKKSSARIVFGCEDREDGNTISKCPE